MTIPNCWRKWVKVGYKYSTEYVMAEINFRGERERQRQRDKETHRENIQR